MAADYDIAGMKSAYKLWAPYYDKVYYNMLADAQVKSVNAAAACGSDILEIGVGTGLALRYYPANSRVIGTDLSEDMLEKAREKVRDLNLTHVQDLRAMDACALHYEENRFDAVVALFVLTLVPEPEKALDEAARVLRPHGEIVIANHIGATSGPMAFIEKLAAPIVRKIGWRPEFPLARIEAWAKSRGFQVIEATKTRPLGYFTVIRLRRI